MTTPQCGAGTLTDDNRYAAVARRDASLDGRFLYAVLSTGVYCRPGCAARLALRKHMSFHVDCEAAERAGFRACKRCRPNEPSRRERQVETVRRACRLIDEAERVPSLDDLARQVGVSRFHFHRVFKQVTGVTPRGYADARRAVRLQDRLGSSGSVTEAIYDAGFNAPSRFYESAAQRLGMTPGAYRRGGGDVPIQVAVARCSLGVILVASTGQGVCAISLGDDADLLVRELRDRFPRAALAVRDAGGDPGGDAGGDAGFERRVARVVEFVEAPGLGLDLPLDIRGTVFQQRVWQALRAIPAGATASYAQIAAGIGAPAAARAVAQACASNVLAVAIPCHRVVRSDGALSGYRWGIERKRELLAREGRGN